MGMIPGTTSSRPIPESLYIWQRPPHAMMSITSKRTALLLVLLGYLATGPLAAQYFRQSSYWKTHRRELDFGFGVANFLGELGGRNQIGSPFVWDLELSQTRPAASFGYRYFIARKQSLHARLSYGVLAGNDNLTEEPFRNNRNLSFKSDIVEFAVMYELHLYREELGHIYDLRGVKGEKPSRVGFYLFAGIGGSYFDPRAQFNNQWIRLKPLSTEGQGLPGGPEEYSNFTLAIPMGIGIRKAVNKNVSIGFNLQYTKTFTDYIDDVSGEYFNNEVIQAERGEIAAFLADPNLGRIPGQGSPRDQRGDPDDLDAYLFLKFHLHYKLNQYRSSSKKYRARIRKQKIVF